MLNEQQQLALEKCISAYKNKERTFGLLGGGGTGKTFTASSIITKLKECSNDDEFNVVLIASTNSALKSLKKAFIFSNTGTNIEFKTLHSALKKQPDISDSGKMVFSGTSSEDDFNKCKVIFVDEASMINKELANELMEIISVTGTFLIICGDKYQHYPVSEESSLLIEIALDGSHQELTQIMRQTGSALSEPIQKCRQAVIKKEKGFDPRWSYPETITEKLEDKTVGYYVLDNNVTRQMWRAFSKAYQENNFDFCKIIAGRNKTVDKLNYELRLALWGEDAEEYIINDLILVKKPVTTKVINPHTNKFMDVILLHTGSEVLVQTASKKLFTFHANMDEKTKKYKEFEFTGWELKVREIGTELDVNIMVLSYESLADYEKLLTKFKDTAKRKVKEAKEKNQSAKGCWSEYYNLVNFFHDVKYGYACTTVYVQGKTYSSVFIDGDDVASLPTEESTNRAFYVALSRAKEKIIIF
jgi:ATP-dependent exoDNAse (exonuclease V) alpha subunit